MSIDPLLVFCDAVKQLGFKVNVLSDSSLDLRRYNLEIGGCHLPCSQILIGDALSVIMAGQPDSDCIPKCARHDLLMLDLGFEGLRLDQFDLGGAGLTR